MDWLVSNKLPHKILFYLGFFLVIFFLGLSYWQFSRYQEDRLILMTINEQQISTDINAEDLYITDDLSINEFSVVNIVNIDKLNLIKSWYLRSRVHNGESGYHLVNLYNIVRTDKYLLINSGWVPLDKNANRTFPYEVPSFSGRLIKYDIQGIGQDDIPGSEFLFRIDKSFLEKELDIYLPDYYLLLIDNCGSGVECIELEEPYDAPHLSYAFQWLFFGIVLSIVILRKNKLI